MKRKTFQLACLLLTVLLVCPALAEKKKTASTQLPAPQTDIGRPLMQVLNERRSTRTFSTKPLSLQTLSNLLWAAAGINRSDTNKRTAPSARNWQEIDIYVSTADGLYRYAPPTHALRLIHGKDIRALKATVMSYYEVPPDVLEQPDELIEWAARSLAIQKKKK